MRRSNDFPPSSGGQATHSCRRVAECHPCTGLHTPICMQTLWSVYCCSPLYPTTTTVPHTRKALLGKEYANQNRREDSIFQGLLYDLTCGSLLLYFAWIMGSSGVFHSRVVMFKEDIFQSCLLFSTTFVFCASCFKNPWVCLACWQQTTSFMIIVWWKEKILRLGGGGKRYITFLEETCVRLLICSKCCTQ